MGECDNARVAIKQTHEREAVIADAAQQGASSRSRRKRRSAARAPASRSSTAIRSRPSTTPRSTRCSNSYQSALRTIWPASSTRRWASRAWPQPATAWRSSCSPNQPLLEEALRGLDQRVRAPDDGMTDVLFVIGSGTAPARSRGSSRCPIPVNGTLVLIPISFPVMRADPGVVPAGQLRHGWQRSRSCRVADHQHRPDGAPRAARTRCPASCCAA